MQQLTITLIALLGMIIPVANSRVIKFLLRVLPPLHMSGRVAGNDARLQRSTVWGQEQGCTPRLRASQLRPLADAWHKRPAPGIATSWRCQSSQPLSALASEQGLFFG